MKTCPACQSTYPDDFSLCPHDGAHLTVQATETEVQLAAGLSRRFRLVRRLGKGGMGTVFLAEQIGVGNRPVALKVLNRKLLDDPDFLMRFQNEAGSTGRIHHPNVVTIYESAQSDDGTPYIAMEFLEGESLREVLKRRGQLPVPEVAEILQQAARGLSAAHKLGIIHRDLKPDNIFLTYPDDDSVARVSPTASAPVSPSAPALALASPPAQEKGAVAPTPPPANFVVKIVDFGIAKLRESGAHTQTGMVLGTPAYMSYEQASGMRSDELDARSDIYSLGVVVYEMLTGRTPFHSDTPVGYLRKHLMEEPPPFRAVAQDLQVPPQVEDAVMKAMKKERVERYQSTLEFAHAFVAATIPAPAPDVNEPLQSTRVVVSPVVWEFDAPIPVPLTAQANVDAAALTPPAPPVRIVEPPSAQPQRGEPVGGVLFSTVAASHPPAAPSPPQSRAISEPPSKVKFVVITVVAVILIGAGVWYFSPSGTSQTGTGSQGHVVETPAPAVQGLNQANPQAPRVQSEQRVVGPATVVTIPKRPAETLPPLVEPPPLRMPSYFPFPKNDADKPTSSRGGGKHSVESVTPAVPVPQPIIVKVLSGPFVVPALGYASVNFQVDSVRMQQPRLVGSFTVVAIKAGNKLDIEMDLLNEEQFRIFARGQSVSPLYNSGRVTSHQVNLSVPQSGTYYLVFNNKFSLITPKTVSGIILLHYLPAQ